MRAGPAGAVLSGVDPGLAPLPEPGVASGAEVWVAGWEWAGVLAGVEMDGLAVVGATTAATGLGCAVVVAGAMPAPRTPALGGPVGRALDAGPWAAAEGDAAGAAEGGTEATGRGVGFTVGAAGVVDDGAGLAC